MYAARLLDGKHELRIQEVSEPEVPVGWALLRVEAAGLCHTDIHVMEGVQFSASTGVDYTVHRPRVLGHEVAGTVVKVGDDVPPELVGEVVAAGGHAVPRATPGMHIDGGFGEFCAVPAANLVRVPPEVDVAVAAVATDSIQTAYAAVTGAGAVAPSDRVMIIGLGGLGMSAVRVAVLAGAEVYGVDIDTARFAEAEAAGAVRCVTDVAELREVRPTLAVDFVGGATTAAALEAVQVGARVVVVGLGASELRLDPIGLVLGKKTLVGSLGAFAADDYDKIIALLARGELLPRLEEVPFAEINEAYARLRAGKVHGRLFTRPTALG
ncbi:alcohol dehydrogenase catalytic domain-containing protein [Pseudonocardia sp. NPDC049154]|uniref:alcohol dehydrogenase catalytic domain-containing protein n=1 Tax=Pseudonocardia sp. NPDC049154 TaxID=3155501 RepID=UPI0033FBA878